MALRIRKRSDSRITFSEKDLEKLDGITKRTRKISPVKPRPNSPPPPPPPTNDKQEESAEESDHSEKLTQHCNNDNTENVFTSQNRNGQDTNIETYKDTEEHIPVKHSVEKVICKNNNFIQQPNGQITTHTHKISISSNSSYSSSDEASNQTKDIPVFDSPPSAPPRKRSNNKQPTINIVTVPEKSSTIKIESPITENPNKTIVQISSPTAVHRIQIKNEFPDYTNVNGIQNISIFEGPQRKTSILINGDDCYSTVNVNDNVPLYQSSVVVNDECSSSVVVNAKKNSSKIYITGSFNPTSDTEKVLTEVSQHLNELAVNQNTAMKDLENSNVSKDRESMLILEDTQKENIGNTSQTLSLPLSLDPTSSSELLKELLRDPVEAVRHNLVPHVCGKSDVARRQRDTKFPKHTMPLGKAESLLDSPLEITNIPTSVEDSFLRLRNYESIGDDVISEDDGSSQYELMDQGSECYTDHSNRSSVTEEELANRTKFYELLAESGNIEVTEGDEHHYESIKVNNDPIYEEIEMPPPLPVNPPPSTILDDLQLDKEYTTR